MRKQLLLAQAECVGLPLITIDLPWPCSNEEYGRIMTGFIADVQAKGIHHMAFGDLFLEDVRAYRERQLAGTGITPLFPLWGSDTTELAQAMIDAGLKARVCTLDPGKLDAGLGGHEFGPALLAALPAGVDPCGENGEFHTLAWDGPMFLHPLPIRVGRRCCRTASSSPICWRRIPNEEDPSGEKGKGRLREESALCVCPFSGRRRCRNWRACRCQNRV